jgi:hypothetical protein
MLIANILPKDIITTVYRQLTATELGSLILSMLSLALVNVPDICIFMISRNCCLLLIQFCNTIAYV